jgi:peptidoglycan/LPS O-acetylase OafA/YrhL
LRKDIQSLRAISVIGVMLYHARIGVDGGFSGVDVFFVISGFVIAKSLRKHDQLGAMTALRLFAEARFRRLWPALALMVFSTTTLSVIFLAFDSQLEASKVALSSLFGLANFALLQLPDGYFSPALENNPFLHTWSLSVEEQLYSVLALIWVLIFAGKAQVSVRGRIWAFAVIAAVSFLSLVIQFPLSRDDSDWRFFAPHFRMWEVLVGAIAFLVVRDRNSYRGPRWTALSSLGFVIVIFALFIPWETTRWPGIQTIVPVFGTLMVLLVEVKPRRRMFLLAQRGLGWVGDRSYSLYLWHWPVLVLGGSVFSTDRRNSTLLLAISVVLATISYRFVETRFRVGANQSIGKKRALSVGLIAAAISSLFLGIGSRFSWWSTSDVATEKGRLAYTCVDRDTVDASCSFNPGGRSGRILLAGDSQAYTYAEGLAKSATKLDFEVVVISRSGCPFLLAPTSVSRFGCEEWQKEALNFATTSGFSGVIVANRSGGYLRSGWIDFQSVNMNPRDSQDSLSLYEMYLSSGLSRFGSDTQVLLVGELPEPKGSLMGESLWSRWFPDLRPKRFTFQEDAVSTEMLRIEEWFESSKSNTSLLSPSRVLCSESRCPLTFDGKSLYTNPSHLSGEGSLLFQKEFSNFLLGISVNSN